MQGSVSKKFDLGPSFDFSLSLCSFASLESGWDGMKLMAVIISPSTIDRLSRGQRPVFKIVPMFKDQILQF